MFAARAGYKSHTPKSIGFVSLKISRDSSTLMSSKKVKAMRVYLHMLSQTPITLKFRKITSFAVNLVSMFKKLQTINFPYIYDSLSTNRGQLFS